MPSLTMNSEHGIASPDKQPVDQHSRDSSSLASTANATHSPPTISILESSNRIIKHSNCASKVNDTAECSMTLRQGIRLYPKAISWSVLLSMTLIMEGYSTILVPNLFAMGPFKEKFGSLQPNGDYEISAAWQSAFVNGGLAGQILGLFATGTLAEYVGYRRTLMIGLVTMALFIMVPFFASTRVVLLAGQCMLGMPWGMFQCVCTVYAADVCPVALRAYLTTYVSQSPLRKISGCLKMRQIRECMLGTWTAHSFHCVA
jgi:SP family general alpha glucoside:H+ symporter-like MFS transporter